MSVSIDGFHSQYIPYDNVRNILRAAKKRGFAVILGCISTKNSRRLKDIAEALGNDIMGFAIMESPCLPVGNALRKIDQNEFFSEDTIPFHKCFNLNTLAVMTDGSAYPCCSQAGVTPALYLGSLKTLSLVEVIKNFKGNMYCRLLEKYGTKWFVDLIKENKLPIELKNKYVGICDVCNTLFKKEEYLVYYEPFIKGELKKIFDGFEVENITI